MKNPKNSARGVALEVLNRVDGGAYADIVLESALKGADERDGALSTELVYGILRWRICLDWVIDSFSGIKTAKMERTVLNALRIGAYQLLFLTKVPPRAAVNETVSLAGPHGSRKAGFVNAVLRKIDSKRKTVKFPDINVEPVKAVSILYSHPEWMVRRWMDRYGLEETAALCKANNAVPPKTLRVNTLIIDRDRLIEELKREGVESRKTGFSPDGIDVVEGRVNALDKRYYIQDEASQLVALILSPAPGDIVLDLLSAPGGKTTHMAQMMKDSGLILAMDIHPGRLASVREAARRLDINMINTMAGDAGERLPFKKAFDAILCDVPCSGLGVLRRTPDIKMRRTEEDIRTLADRQKKMLSNAAACLKKGGRLVYSTCTFEPEETDGVIDWFLNAHGGFIKEGAGGYLPGVCGELTDRSGFLRTYPHRHGTDGFFAARLKKVSD